MPKITINSRVIVAGKPGEVSGLRKSEDERHDLEYEVSIDGDVIREWCTIDQLLREDGKSIKPKPVTVKSIIDELKLKRKEYSKLVANIERKGLDGLNHEETEDYGVYKGKFEAIDMVIKRLKEIKK